jgi:hypothetical protein
VVTEFLFTAKAVGNKQLGSKNRNIVAALFLKESIFAHGVGTLLTKEPFWLRAVQTLRKFRILRYR